MSLNNLGFLMYGVVLMYVLMYWILWFFKVPYYKKMVLHVNEPFQMACTAYIIITGAFLGLEQAIIHIRHEDSPPFSFWAGAVVIIASLMFFTPEWIAKLRNKIPNRWEE